VRCRARSIRRRAACFIRAARLRSRAAVGCVRSCERCAPATGWPAARCANLRRAAAFRRWIPACFAGKCGRGWRYRSIPTTRGREGMIRKSRLAAAGLGAVFCVAIAVAPAAAETPKRGGILTYMIPADAPPSFDGHRETTFATVHAAAPFYSVLIRVNPNNPSSTTDFVCDLCTEMPTPTDDGKTY